MKFEQLDFFKKLFEEDKSSSDIKKSEDLKKNIDDTPQMTAENVFANKEDKYNCELCYDIEGGCSQCGFGRKKKR
ncbi:MAG TPA: hypothetical protein PJ997_02345 [Candidatus Paceibacterota bacterium]|nr:hypothetical protein [Candidatus Paceibacterota bacterium]HMP19153.1 hypothetical protein [Candidatus Paceibacterota bacterium]